MQFHIFDAILVDYTLGAHIAIIVGEFSSVEGHEHVGCDAATSIDGASLLECGHLERVDIFDRIGMDQFAAVESIHDVAIIFITLSLSVGTLDVTSRRGEIVGYREFHHRPVGEGERTLHQSLAECATTHQHASVPILDRSRGNLRCRGTVLVDHHHDAIAIQEGLLVVGLGIIIIARCFPPFGIDADLATLQDLVQDIGGGVDIASSIVGKVENQILHTRFLQLMDCLIKFVERLGAETIQTHIAGGLVDHICRIYAVDRYLGAGDAKIDRIARSGAPAQYLYIDFRTLRPAKSLHNVAILHFHSGDDRVVDADDTVARQNAYSL